MIKYTREPIFFLSNTEILTALAHKFKNWERYRQVRVSKKHMRASKYPLVCTLNTAAHAQAAAFSLPQLPLSLALSACLVSSSAAQVTDLGSSGVETQAGPGLPMIDHFPTTNTSPCGCLFCFVSAK